MHRSFHLLLTIILLTLCNGLLSCKRESRVEWATRNKILLLGNGSEPRALDPHLVSSVNDSNILRSLFEGLVAYHVSDDNIDSPGAAERWESNDDYTEWTFYLRQDGKWSNGDPVTAHDFVYAYERILTPDLVSPYASMLFILKNAEAFNKGELSDFSQVGVKAADDITLVCSLRQPAAYFPELTKHTTYYPVHRPTIEKFGSMTDRFTLWQRPGNHVSNGAFKLKYWRINQAVIVEPNEHYWDRDVIQLKEIHFLPISSEFTEERAFRDRQLHMTYTLPPNMAEWYRKNDPDYLYLAPYAGVYFYRVNVGGDIAPLKDKRVRQALALAIDRQKIVENVTLRGEEPAHGFVPPSNKYEPPNVLRFDPKEGRRLLAEAGYPDGNGFPEVTLFFNTLESHRSIAESVQDMWKRHLGIDTVSLQNQEWKVYQMTLESQNYDIGRAAWIGDYLDATTFLDMWRTGDSNNYTGWSNADYDRILREAALEPTKETRRERLLEAERLLLDELPIIPVYWYTRAGLKHPDLKNWNPLLMDNRPFKFLDVISANASN